MGVKQGVPNGPFSATKCLPLNVRDFLQTSASDNQISHSGELQFPMPTPHQAGANLDVSGNTPSWLEPPPGAIRGKETSHPSKVRKRVVSGRLVLAGVPGSQKLKKRLLQKSEGNFSEQSPK